MDSGLAARYATMEHEAYLDACHEGSMTNYPMGRGIYERYKDSLYRTPVSQYAREIVSACVDCGFEQAIPLSSMWRALEEAETLGMKVDIVPDPEFQPGGRLEGQCDGWSYHTEVVTKEEYKKRYPPVEYEE